MTPTLSGGPDKSGQTGQRGQKAPRVVGSATQPHGSPGAARCTPVQKESACPSCLLAPPQPRLGGELTLRTATELARLHLGGQKSRGLVGHHGMQLREGGGVRQGRASRARCPRCPSACCRWGRPSCRSPPACSESWRRCAGARGRRRPLPGPCHGGTAPPRPAGVPGPLRPHAAPRRAPAARSVARRARPGSSRPWSRAPRGHP